MIDRTLEVLLRLAAAFGPVIALLLVATLLGATLIFLYLILEAGEQGVKLFFPFVKNILLTLISERQHEHAAIKVEFSLHVALILLFSLCLLGRLLHALVPWRVQLNESMLDVLMACSFVAVILLGAVSFKFASRL